MSLRINDLAPDFTALTTQGTIHFHDWIEGKWAVLFSHPKDFTPVCTTELGALQHLQPEFESRHTRVMGLSVDPIEDHHRWLEDIDEITGHRPGYPIVADTDLKVAKLYGMLPADEPGTYEGRTPMDNQTVRSVFVIGPDKRIKLSLTYPMATGRNFKELLRVIDSLQLTAAHKVATPAGWNHGDDVIILPAVGDEEAKALFPEGWKSPKPYFRQVRDPGQR
ncbi:MAG: peroxiredoxin [Pseudomonadota bacterium]